MATTDAQRRATAKYDAKATRHYHLKLNRKTDADVIAALDAAPSTQGYIKALVRANINAMERSVNHDEE